MNARTIDNPVTGERATFVETSEETGGARTVIDLEVAPAGGVPKHRHTNHDERIEVLEGEIEVVIEGKAHLLRAGEHIVIPRGKAHTWRNPSAAPSKFHGSMNPGHPGFERFLRVLFGLARDGQVRPNGLPRRLEDLGLLTEWDPSILSGPLRLLGPVMRWSARRARARGRADELLQRYEA